MISLIVSIAPASAMELEEIQDNDYLIPEQGSIELSPQNAPLEGSIETPNIGPETGSIEFTPHNTPPMGSIESSPHSISVNNSMGHAVKVITNGAIETDPTVGTVTGSLEKHITRHSPYNGYQRSSGGSTKSIIFIVISTVIAVVITVVTDGLGTPIYEALQNILSASASAIATHAIIGTGIGTISAFGGSVMTDLIYGESWEHLIQNAGYNAALGAAFGFVFGGIGEVVSQIRGTSSLIKPKKITIAKPLEIPIEDVLDMLKGHAEPDRIAKGISSLNWKILETKQGLMVDELIKNKIYNQVVRLMADTDSGLIRLRNLVMVKMKLGPEGLNGFYLHPGKQMIMLDDEVIVYLMKKGVLNYSALQDVLSKERYLKIGQMRKK